MSQATHRKRRVSDNTQEEACLRQHAGRGVSQATRRKRRVSSNTQEEACLRQHTGRGVSQATRRKRRVSGNTQEEAYLRQHAGREVSQATRRKRRVSGNTQKEACQRQHAGRGVSQASRRKKRVSGNTQEEDTQEEACLRQRLRHFYRGMRYIMSGFYFPPVTTCERMRYWADERRLSFSSSRKADEFFIDKPTAYLRGIICIDAIAVCRVSLNPCSL